MGFVFRNDIYEYAEVTHFDGDSVPTNEECRAWQGRTKMWSKRQDMCLGLNLCCASAMSRSNDFSHAMPTPSPLVRWECIFHLDCAQQPWQLPPSGQVHLHWLHQQDLQHGGRYLSPKTWFQMSKKEGTSWLFRCAKTTSGWWLLQSVERLGCRRFSSSF